MREDTNSNDLQEIITQAIEEIKNEQGDNFDLQKINLAELSRRTNISRSKLRRLKKNGFEVKPHASTGRKAKETVLSGYTGVIDDLLRHGVTNSEVCYMFFARPKCTKLQVRNVHLCMYILYIVAVVRYYPDTLQTFRF